MLDAPRFDTYHILEAYAKNPESIRNKFGLALLKRRVTRERVWEALAGFKPGMDFSAILDLRTGTEENDNTVSSRAITNMVELPPDERDAIYIEMCKQAGIAMDQSMLDAARKE